ncbi:hypothetical protein D3C76_1433150 [compost metagenome]
MMMTPRSSIIARASRNTFRLVGTRLPSKAITPKAKAISVAAGIAQPWRVTSSAPLNSR